MTLDHAPVLVARDVRKMFRRETKEIVQALDGVSFEVQRGSLTAFVGPDGAGKTTLLRLIAGLLTADSGTLRVLGRDVATEPQAIQDRIGYMPQRFGLYDDLTVQENLDLYADLRGVSAQERRQKYPRLMEMTALGSFTRRLAGNLSGGMKQKLGLACALVRSPELLLLDEPTVGVDPLSRRELWDIIRGLGREAIPVLVTTSYLDEAALCENVIILHQGRVLEQGSPQALAAQADGRTFRVIPTVGQTTRDLQARFLDDVAIVDAVPEGGRVRVIRGDGEAHPDGALGSMEMTPVGPRLEDAFMILFRGQQAAREAVGTGAAALTLERPVKGTAGETIIEVHGLVRQFGNFTAVNHVDFEVRRGEIFGLLGPNGAGKTTTFRMLCGLLAATSGTLRVAGVDLRRARASARQRLGYVAQKFSLYGQLSVTENLDFFARAYGLHGHHKRERIDWAMLQFGLRALARVPSGQLPGGYKQRLAMAAALLHEPEMLFLDEPTSGADPIARREFWRRITALASFGVTVIVTTHFMQEAEYCDRVAILDQGRIIAQGTPSEIRARAPAHGDDEPTMEGAFIAIVEEGRDSHLPLAPAS